MTQPPPPAAPASMIWRTFKFFEQEQVKNSAAIETCEVTAAACGRNLIYLGDALGSVRCVERQAMTLLGSFQPYSKIVTHIRVVKSAGIGEKASLVTIGDDDINDVAIVRIWDTDRSAANRSAASGEGGFDARLLREVKPFAKSPAPTLKPLRFNYNTDLKMTFRGPQDVELGTAGTLLSPIVCFDVTEDLTHLVLALTDSQICVVRGDLYTDRGAIKIQNIPRKHAEGALTFVGFPKTTTSMKTDTTQPNPPNAGTFSVMLFAVYEDVTVAIPLPARGRDLSNVDIRPFDLPTRVGADPECSVINDEGELYVADRASNNIVVYGGEKFVNEKRQRWDGPFAAQPEPMPQIEGEKKKLSWHKGYFVLLVRPDPRKPDRFTFGIFDRDLRIRAVSMPQSTLTNVAWVLPDTSDVLVVWNDSRTDRIKPKVLKYIEITKQAKFDLLFRKDMYQEAKRIARQLANAGGKGSEDVEFDIAKRYGDHLYDKGEYEEAVQQYIEAIRTTEPSYVIRKFLGEQRIANLATYLEALHRKEHGKLANRNHTTLLLNCYAKLKNEKAMEEFIRREDITFDAANAIHVCRQAGYFEAAIYLAQKYDKPDDYVKILIDNLKAYQRAVDYISTLALSDAERILKTHGKAILTHLPPQIGRDLHVRLCTAWVPSGNRTAQRQSSGSTAPTASSAPEQFMASFVDTPRSLMQFLEAVVVARYQRPPSASVTRPGSFDPRTSEILCTLLELYLTPEVVERVRHRAVDPVVASAAAADSSKDGATAASTAPPPTAADADVKSRLAKAYQLLTDYPGMYDPFHALMLSQQYSFERGVVYLLGALNLHSEIFVYYAKQLESARTPEARQRAKSELRKACLEGEQKNPGQDGARDMWISLLSLLVRSQDDVEEDITSLLERIEQHDLLPPVAVIEVLAANKTLPLKAVRNYMIKMITRDQEVIDKCQSDIDDMTAATRKLQSDVLNLQTTAQVFQISKCHACERAMEPPAVYFLCSHAFHEKCLAERRECNICGPGHRRLVQMQKDFDAAADKHDQFFERLRASRVDAEGFSVVAEQFGKGVFMTKWSRAAGDLTATARDDEDDFDDADLYARPNDELTELESW